MYGLSNVGLVWDHQNSVWVGLVGLGLAWFGLARFANRWDQACVAAKLGVQQARGQLKVD